MNSWMRSVLQRHGWEEEIDPPLLDGLLLDGLLLDRRCPDTPPPGGDGGRRSTAWVPLLVGRGIAFAGPAARRLGIVLAAAGTALLNSLTGPCQPDSRPRARTWVPVCSRWPAT